VEAACLAGDLESCRLAMKGYESGEAVTENQRNRYVQLGMKACKLGDRKGCEVFLLNAEVRSIEFWQNQREVVAQAPQALIELLRIDNQVNGYRERPVAASPDPKFVSLLQTAIRDIPRIVGQVLGRKLVGVFLVENLGSTALAMELLDGGAPSGASFIVLDVTKLGKPANAWATWKEGTPFKAGSGASLEVTIEGGPADSVQNAIQYVVLHEMGHVLERAREYSPPKDERPQLAFLRQYAFLAQSWLVLGDAYRSRFDDVFRERRDLRFYASRQGDQLPMSSAAGIYKALNTTSFPTLYAATNPWDDFAESFASYVHSVLQKRPYRVLLRSPGQPATLVLESCWEQPRCKAKRQFFDRVFAR
jgi:hypothetical protein